MNSHSVRTSIELRREIVDELVLRVDTGYEDGKTIASITVLNKTRGSSIDLPNLEINTNTLSCIDQIMMTLDCSKIQFEAEAWAAITAAR